MDEIRDLAQFYKALGDETRLRLVELLSRQEMGMALCVGRLAHQIGVTPSAVSQHLRVLKDLGLIRAERQRYRIHYYLNRGRFAAYQDLARQRLGEGFVILGAGPTHHQGVDPLCCRKPIQECAHREKPEGDPSECTLERIRECHGEVTEHPCECGCTGAQKE